MDWKDALASLNVPAAPEPEPEPAPEAAPAPAPAKAVRLTVRYEKKGRAGKPATILAGFPSDAAASAAAAALKRALGVGGSARDDEVLLQGDQRLKLAAPLAKLGYRI